MLWYRITDFLKTRTGHLTLFAVAVILLFLGAAKYFKKKEGDETLLTKQFPRLSNEAGWAEPGRKTPPQDPDRGEVFEHQDPNVNFSPLRPPSAAPRRPNLVEVVPTDLEEPSVELPFVPLPPLIKYQGRTAVKTEPDPSPQLDPPEIELPREPAKLEIEVGALLYARLLAPLSSDLAKGAVSAELTRALIRNGKVLAPKGAALVGSVQGAAGDRLLLSSDWQIRQSDGTWLSFQAEAQESSIDPTTGHYTLNDGRVGLPGLLPPRKGLRNPLWAKTLKTLAVVSGRLAQDRVRTAVGDYVPGTARNVILEGTSRVIEEHGVPFLGGDREGVPAIIVEAGRSFYLNTVR